MSPVDERVDWKRINIFGGSGIGRGPVYPGLGSSGGRFITTTGYSYPDNWFGGKLFWYATVSWEGQPTRSRGIPSIVRVRASGCYGVQIDGTTFSRIVIFAASTP